MFAAAVLCQSDIWSSGYLLMFHEVTNSYFFISLEKKRTQNIFFLPREIKSNPSMLQTQMSIWEYFHRFSSCSVVLIKTFIFIVRFASRVMKKGRMFWRRVRAASLHFLPAQVVLLFRYDGGHQAHHGSFKNTLNELKSQMSFIVLRYSSSSLLQLTLSEALLRKHNSSQRCEEKVSAAFIPAQTKVITFFFKHILIKQLRIQSASFSGAFNRLEFKKKGFLMTRPICVTSTV